MPCCVLFILLLLGVTLQAQAQAQTQAQDSPAASAETPSATVPRAWIAPEPDTLGARVIDEPHDGADRFLWLDEGQRAPMLYRSARDAQGRGFSAERPARGVVLCAGPQSGAFRGHLWGLRQGLAAHGWHVYQPGLPPDDTAGGSRLAAALAFVQERHAQLPIVLVLEGTTAPLAAKLDSSVLTAMVTINATPPTVSDGPVMLAIWVTPRRPPAHFVPPPQLQQLLLPKSHKAGATALLPRRVAGWLRRTLAAAG